MKATLYLSSTGNLPFVCLIFKIEFTIFRLVCCGMLLRFSLSQSAHSQYLTETVEAVSRLRAEICLFLASVLMAGRKKINWRNILLKISELEWGSLNIWDADEELLPIYLKIANQKSTVERKKARYSRSNYRVSWALPLSYVTSRKLIQVLWTLISSWLNQG